MYGDKLKLLNNNKDNIISLYSSGQNIKSLGYDFGVSEMTMRKFLIANKIKTRSNPKERKFDTSFFFNENARLAYFMGFCLADGSITSMKDHRSTLEIDVHTQDASILEKFCEWTNYDTKFITKRKNKELLRLCFNNKIFKTDFSSWGLVNNKTYSAIVPTISDNLIRPFLIGYIDGDGSINLSNGKSRSRGSYFNVVGNRLLIDWFCEQMKRIGFDLPFKFEDIEGKIWKRARLYKKNEIILMVDKLDIKKYKSIALNRKWHHFL